MRHARPDYQRFQDPDGIIPTNEPVFLIRGQDSAAPETLEFYADLCHANGAELGLSESVRAHALEMREYQGEYGHKTADIPEEILAEMETHYPVQDLQDLSEDETREGVPDENADEASRNQDASGEYEN